MTYRWPVTYGVTSTARVYGADYNIVAVDTVVESFKVAGDQTLIFGVGVTFEVNGSTGNDGDWVVAGTVWDMVNTEIFVTGDVTNAVADGVITPYTIPVADELRIAFWDTVGTTFVQDTICLDSLQNQWANQRCGIGYKADGKWGVAHIEADSNDLEYWQNATAGWIASGAWGLLDDDNSEDWEAVDVETRQNWVHGGLLVSNVLHGCSIDLSAGVPAWNTYAGPNMQDDQFSVIMNRQLFAWDIIAFRDTVDQSINLAGAAYNGFRSVDSGDGGAYLQVVCDRSDWHWVFFTGGNLLSCLTYPLIITAPQPYTVSIGFNVIYTATALTANYKATHNPVDDTIHVILVDTITNADELIYLRRTPNGWSAPITLQTGGNGEIFSWPQITCDSFNNINVYYIHDGDLVNLLLPSADYADFATPANWDKTANVDGTGDTIKHCNAISNMPEDI